jgi:hypothetical protein
MADDTTVEVRITADSTQAKEEFLATSTAVKTSFDGIKTSAADLQARLALSQENFRQASAATKDYAKQILDAGTATSAATRGGLSEAAGAMVSARTESAALATELAKLSGTAGGLHGSLSTATREFRALFDELSSGRTRMVPGTLAIIGQRVFGLGPAALGAVGGVVALTAALVYLAVEAVKTANAIDSIGIGAKFAGNIELTRAQIVQLIDTLHTAGNMSKSDAEATISSLSRIKNETTPLLQGLSVEVADYAQASGKDLEKAREDMVKAFTDPLANAKKFVESLGGVTQAQIDAATAAERSGEANKAAAVMLGALDAALNRARPAIAEHNAGMLASIKNALTYTMLMQGGITGDKVQNLMLDEQNEKMKKRIDLMHQYLSELSAKPQTSEQTLQVGIKSAEGEDKTTKEIADVQAGIARISAALADAKSKGDQVDVDKLNKGLKSAEEHLDTLQLGPVLERARTQVAQLEATWSGTQSALKQAEHNVWAGVLAETREGSSQRLAVVREMASTETQARKEGGQEAIANAREQISLLQSEGKLGATQMLEAEGSIWSKLLSGDKLNAAQRLEVQKSFNESLARLHGTENSEQLHKLEAVTDAAKKGSQQRIDAAAAEVKFTVGVWKEGSDQAIAAEKRHTAAVQEQADQRKAIEAEWASFQQRMASGDLANEKAKLAEEVQAGKISKEQEYEILNQYATKEWQLEKETLERELSDEQSTAQQKLKAWEQLYDGAVKYQRQIADNARLESKAVQDDWMKALQPIEKGFDTLVRDMLTGHKKLGAAAKQAAATMVLDFIEADVKSLEHWVATQAAKLLSQQAGDAASVASNAAANSAKGVSDIGATLGSITKNAASAAAAVYNDVAQIPYVGWLLAPPAAAAAFVAVEAFGSLIPSAAGGMVVGGDGLIMAHAQEMVLPARLSTGIQSMIDAGAPAAGAGVAGGTGGAAGGSASVALNVTAMDSQSVITALRNPYTLRAMTRAIQGQLNTNPSLRGTF